MLKTIFFCLALLLLNAKAKAAWIKQDLESQFILKQGYSSQSFVLLQHDERGYELLEKHRVNAANYDFFSEVNLSKKLSFTATANAVIFKDNITQNFTQNEVNHTSKGQGLLSASAGIRRQVFRSPLFAFSTRLAYTNYGKSTNLTYNKIFGSRPDMLDTGILIGFGTGEAFINRFTSASTAKPRKIFAILDLGYKASLQNIKLKYKGYTEANFNITLGHQFTQIGLMMLVENFNTYSNTSPFVISKEQYTGELYRILSVLSTSFIFDINKATKLQLAFTSRHLSNLLCLIFLKIF
jgi:hypothetical protein